jgi:HK97 family phage prohead protease
MSEAFEFDGLTAASFAYDELRRTMTGVVVPWGKVGRHKNGRKWRFQRGALKYGHEKYIRLNEDHVHSARLGRAVAAEDSDKGLVMSFRLYDGREGDRALALAADGVKTGFSVEIEFDEMDSEPDPENPGVRLVTMANLTAVAFVRDPAFTEARLISVRASQQEGSGMPEEDKTPEGTPAEPQPVTFSKDQFDALIAQLKPDAAADVRPTVNPVRPVAVAQVTSEPVPYRFDRGGNFVKSDNEFSADIRDMLKAGDKYGVATDAGRRAMDYIRADFATVVTTDVDETNPAIQRPDLFVDKRDYQYPLWNIVNKGAPPNGVQPFTFPKYNSSGTLVAAHTEGTEPTAGGYTTTSQTVTPTALSGKASISREVFDMGGNPAVSQLIRNQMRRDWFEGLELGAGTFLNTLTAATDISLNTGATSGAAPTSAQLLANWDGAVADLMFTRAGQTLTALALEPYLYKAFVNALDGNGRPLFPILNPQNSNGSVAPRFRTLDLAGITGVPAWGLGAGTGGSANNSWLFDPDTVWGFATAPQYFDFPGTASGGGYAPVAMVDIAVWGYKAFANSDINGVRQITYDTTT